MKHIATKNLTLDTLTPFPGNARRGNIEALRESIRANGQYRSLVVRQMEDGQQIILAGNHTAEAMKLEEFKKARCEVIECTDEEALRINLADNKLGDLGTYDKVALAEQLQELAGDLDGIGYSQDELEVLLRSTDAQGNKATEFLSGMVDPDKPTAAYQGATKSDAPPADPEGTAYVTMSWTCTGEQREAVRLAVQQAQKDLELGTSTEALVAIAKHYLTGKAAA